MSDDERILWGVVANARVHQRGLAAQRSALWVLVARATGQGSTASAALCRRFGFAPDSTSAKTDKGTP